MTAAEMPGFHCVVRDGGVDTAWIHAIGELDLATAPRLDQALGEAARCARRVLDLREVTFMDSAGLRVIVDASDRAKATPGRLVLVRGPSQVDRFFALTGTARRLEIVDLGSSDPLRQTFLDSGAGDAATGGEAAA
jgi:anti-sigma B factor antagonist